MKSETLKETQKKFLHCLFEEKRALAAAKPGSRMGVYVDAFWIRIEEGLAEDFEQVRAAIGPKHFSALVKRYIQAHPSRTWTMALVGAKLPEHLLQDPLTRKFPFLPDLARLDWAITMVYPASAPQALPLEVFTNEKTLLKSQLALIPSAQLLCMDWHRSKPCKTRILIHPAFHGIKKRFLPVDEYETLLLLQKPQSISKFLEKTAKKTNPAKLRKWTVRWARDGILQWKYER